LLKASLIKKVKNMSNETEITKLAAELKASEEKNANKTQILRANPSFYDVKAHNTIIVKDANEIINRNEKVQVCKLQIDALNKTMKAVKLSECPAQVHEIKCAKSAWVDYCKEVMEGKNPNYKSYEEAFIALKEKRKVAVVMTAKTE